MFTSRRKTLLFTSPEAVAILLDSWRYLLHHEGWLQWTWKNHLHFVAQAERLDKCPSKFKDFATPTITRQETQGAETFLHRIRFVWSVFWRQPIDKPIIGRWLLPIARGCLGDKRKVPDKLNVLDFISLPEDTPCPPALGEIES
ncbi:MAG: hypothetical protein HGA96_06305 [Desulfobulbaceae bacterium]|nr:hypothetical protein [Desulfobulbaceae bacterium]